MRGRKILSQRREGGALPKFAWHETSTCYDAAAARRARLRRHWFAAMKIAAGQASVQVPGSGTAIAWSVLPVPSPESMLAAPNWPPANAREVLSSNPRNDPTRRPTDHTSISAPPGRPRTQTPRDRRASELE